jgi:hypothetical protein
MIIDHTCCKLRDIPDYWIAQAKQQIHFAYGCASHGTQLPSGMGGETGAQGAGSGGLVGWTSGYGGTKYAFNNGGTGGALDFRWWHDFGNLGISMSIDLLPSGNADPPRTAWVTATQQYLAGHPEITHVMWSWCYGLNDTGNVAPYLQRMESLEAQFPNVTFIYMTGRTNASGVGSSGYDYQSAKLIREYCKANNKILYDFHDIESWDPDGEYYDDLGTNENCDYSGGNWATAWQSAHSGEWYNTSASSNHTQPLNENLKAFATWHMLARLAGWDGVSKDSWSVDWSKAGVWDNNVKGIPDTSSWTVYNVKNAPYNAVGDGIHDDTANIQSAINASGANSIIYFPEGTYLISSALRLNYPRHHVLFLGDGPTLTTIAARGIAGSVDMIRIEGSMWDNEIVINSGATKGSTQITLQNASTIAIGDIIGISPLEPSGWPDTPGITRLPFESTYPPSGQPYEGWSYDRVAFPRTGTGSNCGWFDGFVQFTEVIGKSSNTLTLRHPITYDYTGYNPRARKWYMIHHVGIEDMYIVNLEGGTPMHGQVNFLDAAYCWSRRLHIYKCPNQGIGLWRAHGCEIYRNYIHHGVGNSWGGDSSYLICLKNDNCNNLIYDNILRHGRHNLPLEGGGQANVISYNYSLDPAGDDGSFLYSDFGCHGRHPYMNLWEGNYCAKFSADNFHGSSSHGTLLRNRILGDGVNDNYPSGVVNGRNAVQLFKNAQYYSLIGNVIGYPGCATNGYYFQRYVNGEYDKRMYFIGQQGDNTNQSTNPDFSFPWRNPHANLFMFRNYDFVTNSALTREDRNSLIKARSGTTSTLVHFAGNMLQKTTDNAYNGCYLFNHTRASIAQITAYDADNGSGHPVLTISPAISGQVAGDLFYILRPADNAYDGLVPNSLYLTSRPAFFGSLDWPAIGPDVAGYYKNIPAVMRWNNYRISGRIEDLFSDSPVNPGDTLLFINTSAHANAVPNISLVLGQTPNFSLSAVPTGRVIEQRQSTTFTITATSSGGFNKNILMFASGLPYGCTASFSPVTIGPNGSTILTIDTTNMISPVGGYTITVTGNELP